MAAAPWAIRAKIAWIVQSALLAVRFLAHAARSLCPSALQSALGSRAKQTSTIELIKEGLTINQPLGPFGQC
jgi:hypothetical protein